ncbi:MAG: hypothetical protein ACJAYC_003838 [Halieaceae bacterium]|jgi:hypothetical protein
MTKALVLRATGGSLARPTGILIGWLYGQMILLLARHAGTILDDQHPKQ